MKEISNSNLNSEDSSQSFKIIHLRLVLPLIAVIVLTLSACTSAQAELLDGILQTGDAANGEITIVTKDGKSVTLKITTDVPVETEGAFSALETLESGTPVEVEVSEDGQAVRRIKARQVKVEGTVVRIEGNEITIESEQGRKAAVIVTDRTRIQLEGDLPGTLAHLQVGVEVEIKFDPESRVAFKISTEEEEAEIEGVVVSVESDEVTIETERGRRLTLVIGDRTKIEFEDDFSGTMADLQVGKEIEAKFDPATRTAFKIEIEEDDEKKRQLEETATSTETSSPAATLAATPQAITVPTPIPTQDLSDAPRASSLDAQPVNFRLLISDDRNAIDDFTHLWVTIDRVGVQQRGESGGWRELDVPEERRKVDLVELTGDTAVEIIGAQIPPGEYTKVFIHVDDVTGELQSGITTPVKLPSHKLQIIKPFKVRTGSLATFVFDISVVAAGSLAAGSEKRRIKYVLQPVIAQSGADRPFEEVKLKKESWSKLTLQLEGDPQPGATSTLVVTDADGNLVQGAVVTVNGEAAGITDAQGRLFFTVPEGADELEIKAKLGGSEGELELDLEDTEPE